MCTHSLLICKLKRLMKSSRMIHGMKEIILCLIWGNLLPAQVLLLELANTLNTTLPRWPELGIIWNIQLLSWWTSICLVFRIPEVMSAEIERIQKIKLRMSRMKFALDGINYLLSILLLVPIEIVETLVFRLSLMISQLTKAMTLLLNSQSYKDIHWPDSFMDVFLMPQLKVGHALIHFFSITPLSIKFMRTSSLHSWLQILLKCHQFSNISKVTMQPTNLSSHREDGSIWTQWRLLMSQILKDKWLI